MSNEHPSGNEVAIIGMTGRFPGAQNTAELWNNIQGGICSISFFADEDLIAAGVPVETVSDTHYVKAQGMLQQIDLFDAAFFGFSARDAEMMGPQHRLFLECAVEVLEDAGYFSEAYDGRIGVFAGTRASNYLTDNILSNAQLLNERYGLAEVLLANEKDTLPLWVSYKLNLKGPSIGIQTACSTSLVAVHLACQSLLSGECDIALAGGVAIDARGCAGYWYQEGGTNSPDGYCRPFDAQAQGIVPGNGAGIVALKRLADALDDRDHIYAVIKGSMVNNDGALKMSFAAPSVEGQAEVVEEALALAGVNPDTIDYIETHGTGTRLGDPIEIAALTRVFGKYKTTNERCAIGSIKGNIGHLDTAAGVAGLIKAALALHHRQLPPSLHFTEPNPNIDWTSSPFYVNTSLTTWERQDGIPRRAGVSSLGMGGTNAHVVLEEAPSPSTYQSDDTWQLLLLSTKTMRSLDRAAENLAEHLRANPDLSLADVAYTLQVGRKHFKHRHAVVCQQREDALAQLANPSDEKMLIAHDSTDNPPVTFLFPGVGTQYVYMAADMYRSEPLFRKHVDCCARLLQAQQEINILPLIYPESGSVEENSERLSMPFNGTLAIFVIEYALAQLWMSWGIHPQAMIGHSLGEYVAACIAHVLSLEDALALVATRGKLLERLPGGTMLSVALSENDIKPFLGDELSLAAINGPALCVVSGPKQAIYSLEHVLSEQKVDFRPIHMQMASHSAMVLPILEDFSKFSHTIKFNVPTIPYISNVTGTWITNDDALDPDYWVRHLRLMVRFSQSIQCLLEQKPSILLEVGPGRTLSTLAKPFVQGHSSLPVLCSLPHPSERRSDRAFLLTTLGKLWLAGAQIDWPALHVSDERGRVSLPTYPFERQRFWIEAKRDQRNLTLPTSSPSPSEPVQRGGEEDNCARASASLTSYIPPSTEVETIIAEIWQDLLGISPIGVYDNFFDLGGHSLTAIRLLARLKDAFPVLNLSMSNIFTLPTIAGLAEFIEELLLAHIEGLPEDDLPVLNGQTLQESLPDKER